MWLQRLVDAITEAPGPVVLVGGEAHGTPFLIDAVRSRHRVAWAGIGRSARDDEVAMGNALATALNAALGATAFPHALPIGAHLRGLAQHRRDLAPLWIAVSAPCLPASLAGALLGLDGDGYRVVLAVDEATWPAGAATVLLARDLAVRPDEADALLPASIRRDAARRMLEDTGGRFTDLLERAHRSCGLPVLRLPSPDGPMVPASEAEAVEPALAVLALRRDGRAIEALELAALRAPDMVDELLRSAGPAYQEHGLLARLHLVLSAVPRPYAGFERTLEWRLVAALAVDELAAVAPEVDAYLATHEAPELRARRAGTLSATAGFPLAERAVSVKRTPLTVWQYGRQHPDPSVGIRVLRESVELAEDAGTPYDQVRNAGALAARLAQVGAFDRAAAWASWGLQVFDAHRLRDGTRRLVLLNDLAFARIMTGDVVGLHRTLHDAYRSVEAAVPAVAGFFRTTMAFLELALDRPADALAHLQEAYESSPRRARSRYAYQYVRVLNELRRFDDAARVADEALELSGDDVPARRRVGHLARGMVRAVRGAAGAADDLLEVLVAPDAPAEQRIAAALHYLHATEGAAHHLPEDVSRLLARAHPIALRVLSGPAPAMQRVWDLLGGGADVQLEFFGSPSCRSEGRRSPLPPRLAEAALAVALHPDGIDAGTLNAFLTPDGVRPFTGGGLRGLLTRLRTVLPVSDAPYRLTVPYTADVLEVRERLRAGRVREAISLLRGPLLPSSQAPGVEELRWAVDEELRQAALRCGDGEALFDLADRLGDDLEVWEAAAASLAPTDPRMALVQARVRRLSREYA